MFLGGLIVGLAIGVFVGVFAIALCNTANNEDHYGDE